MNSIIVALIGAGIYVAALVFVAKRAEQSSESDPSGPALNINEMAVECAAIDEKITSGLKYVAQMIPYGDYIELDKGLEVLKEVIADQNVKLGELDAEIAQYQQSVEEKEDQHTELKRGKDQATQLAADMRSKQQAMAEEFDKLESQLADSLNQLEALSSEVQLTAQQSESIANINQSVAEAQAQLASLQDIKEQASRRFLNLDHQYQELEKEFTKLVEKELAGI